MEKVVGLKTEVEVLLNGTFVAAGTNRLHLPSESGIFCTKSAISQWWFDGIYFLIEKPEYSLVAFNQLGQKLWTTRPSDVKNFSCRGFVGAHALEVEDVTYIYFGNSDGHVFRVTNLVTGEFEYLYWGK